jgi:hypothetical protein
METTHRVALAIDNHRLDNDLFQEQKIEFPGQIK